MVWSEISRFFRSFFLPTEVREHAKVTAAEEDYLRRVQRIDTLREAIYGAYDRAIKKRLPPSEEVQEKAYKLEHLTQRKKGLGQPLRDH